MIEAIERIEGYLVGVTAADFLADRLRRDAVVLNVEIIGEAAGRVLRHAPGFAAAHPAIPWREAYRVRNRLSHGYDTVDAALVWRVVTGELRLLLDQLRALLPPGAP